MALDLNPTIFSKLRSTPQRSALFIGLGTLVLVIALFVFAIVPATSSVVEQYEKNKKRQELVEQQETKIENLNKLVNEEEKYAQQIKILNENYPIFVDTEYVIRNIQDYADQNDDINIANIDVDDKYVQLPSYVTSSEMSKYDRYDIQGVNMTISYYCSIEGSVKFLKFFENFPSLLNVEKTSYAYQTDTNAELPPNTPYTCGLTVFYYTKFNKPNLTTTPVPAESGNQGS